MALAEQMMRDPNALQAMLQNMPGGLGVPGFDMPPFPPAAPTPNGQSPASADGFGAPPPSADER